MVITDAAAEEDNLEALVFQRFHHGVYGVRNNRQVMEFLEVLDDFEGRGPGVDENRVAVLDMRGGGAADSFLLPGVDQTFEIEVAVLFLVGVGVGAGDGSAVDADEQLPLTEDAEVLANRNFRNPELAAEFGHIYRGFFPQALKNSGAAALG